MRLTQDQVHAMHLSDLESRLELIGEDKSKLVSLIVEPAWYKPNTHAQYKLCDMILIYPHYAVPLEYKSSRAKRDKAIQQLISGKKYCSEVLTKNATYGLFVSYSGGKYLTEKILYHKIGEENKNESNQKL